MLVPLWLALPVRLVAGPAVAVVVVLGRLLVQQGGSAGTAVVAGALRGAALWVSGRLQRGVSGRARAERAGAEDPAAGAGVVPAQRPLGAR